MHSTGLREISMHINIFSVCFWMMTFISSTVVSQSYAFKVLANKGNNMIKTNSAWSILKTGVSLANDDELKIADNAYVGLVHVSGKTLELKETGVYKVSDMVRRISPSGSGVASKYADFILSKMSAEGKKNRLNAIGAVFRSAGDNTLNIFIPGSSTVFNKKVIIRWDSLNTSGNYIVTLSNMFNDTLLKLPANTPEIALNLTDDKIADEKVILVSVSDANDKTITSGTYAIKKISASDFEHINKSLNDLKKNIGDEMAVNQYIMAGFFEMNKLYIDAITHYEIAMQKAPDVDSYKYAYEEFLLRNRLKGR